MEKKRVNIFPRRPITTVIPPIRVPVYNVSKEIKDIRACIMAGARVEEILSDGTTVNLNMGNYSTDNEPKIIDEARPVNTPENVDVNFSAAQPPITPEEAEQKAAETESKPEEATTIEEEKNDDGIERMDVDSLNAKADNAPVSKKKKKKQGYVPLVETKKIEGS